MDRKSPDRSAVWTEHEDARGVDVTLIDRMLVLTPQQRLDAYVRHMRLVERLRNAKPAI